MCFNWRVGFRIRKYALESKLATTWITFRSCIQRRNVKHINMWYTIRGVLHEFPFISSYPLRISNRHIPLHIAIRKLTYCNARSRNTYSSSWCSCSGEKKIPSFLVSSFSFLYVESSFIPNSAIPNCYAVEITKRSLSLLPTVLRVQGATKPQASLRAISGPCVPHYVVFVHPQNHFQSPSSIYHPCPRPTNFSNWRINTASHVHVYLSITHGSCSLKGFLMDIRLMRGKVIEREEKLTLRLLLVLGLAFFYFLVRGLQNSWSTQFFHFPENA
jgi:hypothetical protein